MSKKKKKDVVVDSYGQIHVELERRDDITPRIVLGDVYRKEIMAEEYKEWLRSPQRVVETGGVVHDCIETVLTFLDSKGLLKDENERLHGTGGEKV